MIEMKANLIENEQSLDKSHSRIHLTQNESQPNLVTNQNYMETLENFPKLSNRKALTTKCVMNRFFIFNDTEYSAFTCVACNIENICQYCYEKCHAGHNSSNMKGINQSKTLSIKTHSCNCAMNDHESKIDSKHAEFKRMATIQTNSAEAFCCPLKEVFSLSNSVYNYFDEKIQRNICSYCCNFCADGIDELSGKWEGLQKIKSTLGDRKSPCGCSKPENHSTIEENISNIYTVISDLNFGYELNLTKLSYQLMTNKIFLNKFLGGFISNSDVIKNSLENGGPSIKEMWGVTRGNYNYDIAVQLLDSLAKKYSSGFILPKVFKQKETDFNLNENIMEEGPIATISNKSEYENLTLEIFFSPEFLIKLFSLPEKKKDVLFSFKLNCFKFYRKFVFIPMIKNKNFFSLDSYENVSAIHRIFLGRNVPDELKFYSSSVEENKNTKKNNVISQPILEILLEKVLTSFLNYSEKEIEMYQYIQLGIQLLKFFKRIIPFYHLNHELIVKTFEKVEKIMSVLKTKKAYENLVIKHLEKIIFTLMILNNDYILYNKLFLDENENKSKEYLKNVKFSFEKNEFNKKLIFTLFSYSKDYSDNSDYLKNIHIYDDLVNAKDYYSENLESLLKSSFKEILNSESFIKFVKIENKEAKNSPKNLSYKLNLFKSFFLNEEEEAKNILSKQNQNMEKVLENFLSNPTVNEEMFFQNLVTDLKEYKNVLEEYLSGNLDKNLRHVKEHPDKNLISDANCISEDKLSSEKFINLNSNFPQITTVLTEETKFNSFRKKIALFQMGCFDVIFNLCKFLNSETYFSLEIFSIKIKEILGLIYEIFEIFSNDNPFISALFFNKTFINTIFKNKNMLKDNLKFLLNKLKILCKSNYKINPELIIEKILQQINFVDYTAIDHDTKQIILKIFVNSLKIVNEKSLMIINDRISSEILKILFSDDFVTDLDNFIFSLKSVDQQPKTSVFSNFGKSQSNSSINTNPIQKKGSSKGGGFVAGILRKKTLMNMSENASGDNTNLYIEVIKLTYSCINLLSPEYFYLIVESLRIEKISQILEQIKTLEPQKRRIFTKTYFRFFVESYFKIHTQMSQGLLDSYCHEIDVNVINANFAYLSNHKIHEDLHNESVASDLEGLFEKEIQISIKGMEPIIRNLEKFKRIFSSHNEYFKKIKLNLKYFEEVIFFPSMYSIYKICYFEKEVSARFKYTVYRVIFLFLQCLKFHVDNLKNCDFMIKENYDKFLKYFYVSNKFRKDFINSFNHISGGKIISQNSKDIQSLPQTEENQKMIQEYLDKLITDLENDIMIMDSENFQQLNLRSTLEIYFKYATKFMSYHKIIHDSDDVDKISKIEETIHAEQSRMMGGCGSMKNIINSGSVKNLGHNFHAVKNSAEEKISVKTKISSNSPILTIISEFLKDYRAKKEMYEEDNILNEIFSIDPESDPYIQKVKDTIALDLLMKLELPKTQDTLSLYNEKNTKHLNSIIKLFKTDPTTWQNIIVDSVGTSKFFFTSLISSQLAFLLQFIFIEFNRLDTKNSAYHKNNFLTCIEYIRLLCEDHNKIFQTYLINSKILESEEDKNNTLYLINFILKIPSMIATNIQYYISKKEIRKFLKYDTLFFSDVLEKITELLIEIMQGAFSFNFDRIAHSKEFEDYFDIHYKNLDFLELEGIYEIVTANFVKVLNCYIEENSNSIENKLEIVKKINPGKLYDAMFNSFKRLYTKEIVSKNENLRTSNNLSKVFTKNFHEELIQSCIRNWEDISESPLFVIASGIFIYFKIVSYYKGGFNEKIKRILENLEKLSESDMSSNQSENEISRNKQPWLEVIKSELFLFLNKLIKEVEICYRQDENLEDSELKRYKSFFEKDLDTLDLLNNISEKQSEEKVGIDKVIFLVHPDSLFIKSKDYYYFMNEAPLDNFNTKLNCTIEYFPELMKILRMRKMLNNFDSSRLLSRLYELDYKSLEIYSAVLSSITNFLMFSSLKYFHHEKIDEGDLEIHEETPDMNYSVVHDPYESHTMKVSFFHLVLLSMIIINWFSFSIVKHVKYNQEKINFFYRIYLYFTFIFKSEIFPFIWNFTFGVIPLLDTNLKYIRALQLFTIFNIFPTMFSVLFAVKMRYKQFISTGFLLVILILFFASVSFYFYRDELYNDDIHENICGSYLQCFMYMLNNGIRAGDGVSFGVKTIYTPGYWSEFIYSWFFYFMIMLIMVNIINGIIVDTFQALREQNNEKDDAMVNVCFICSLNRQKFEIKGLSFEEHVQREHWVLNYFEYFAKIKMTDEHDLNSLDFQVLNSINAGRTDFFPIKKAKCLEKN